MDVTEGSNRWRHRLAVAVAAMAVGLPALAQSRGSDPGTVAESLCPRLSPFDDDCYTAPLPAEAWAVAAVTEPTSPEALALYEDLVPAPYRMPATPQVGVFLARLQVGGGGHRFEDDPGQGYQEGTIALRVALPESSDTPWQEGWFVLVQPISDSSQYASGRDVGLPKYVTAASIDNRGTRMIEDARGILVGDPNQPGATADPATGGALTIDWSQTDGADATAASGLVTLDSPLLGHDRPYDEPNGPGVAELTKFTPSAYLPVGEAGAGTPLTASPDVRTGASTVTLTGTIPTTDHPWSDLTGGDTWTVPGAAAYVSGFVHMTFDRLDDEGSTTTTQPPADEPGSPPADPGAPTVGVPLPTASGGPVPQPLGGTCSTAPATGGEWPTYARDLTGARTQPDETTISAAAAPNLAPTWTFPLGDIHGIFNSTPIVSGGCLFAGTSSGSLSGRFGADTPAGPADYDIFAINADTGDPVWRLSVPTAGQGVLGTGVVGSLAIDPTTGVAYAIVSSLNNPYTLALDMHTGEILWSTLLDDQCGAYADASPILFDGLVFAGWNEDLQKECARGGYSVLDAATGEVLVKRFVIPQDDFDAGYTGASIWATAAVDTATGFAYVGTSNPDNLTSEHELTNSILKIDLNRTSPDFGQIVDHYRGDIDNVPANVTGTPLYTPVCTDVQPALEPTMEQYFGDASFSVDMAACLNGDQDFGASPQLFTIDGRLAVGELQKSGNYHVAWADTMEPVWTTRVGTLCVICNAGTAATDGETIWVEGAPPGQLFALDARTGSIKWVTPVLDVLHFQGITHANGVVYTVDSRGNFDAFDAATGFPLVHRPVGMDNGGDYSSSMGNLAGSVAVARNTVYVASGTYIGAYRP